MQLGIRTRRTSDYQELSLSRISRPSWRPIWRSVCKLIPWGTPSCFVPYESQKRLKLSIALPLSYPGFLLRKESNLRPSILQACKLWLLDTVVLVRCTMSPRKCKKPVQVAKAITKCSIRLSYRPVSYTHLTLPTIYSV